MPWTRRPDAELLRQLVHLLSGAGAFLLYYWPKWAVLGLLGAGVLLVAATHLYGSKGRQWNPLYREGESLWRNGAIRYAIGVGLAVLLFAPRDAFVGWLVFAAGDSTSTVVGRRWPLRRILSGTAGRGAKSVGGFLGFVVVAALVAWMGDWWWSGGTSAGAAVRVLGVAAVCGAAELLVPRVDDNFYLAVLGALLSALTNTP